MQAQAEESGKVKEAYEADLAAYKKDLKEYWEPLETKLKDLEQKEDKKLKESADLTVRVENLEDKQTGAFKAPAAGSESYSVTQKDPKEKKNMDFSYRPGGK